jgi:methylamine dehydrogenase accessory protein MauD
MSDALLISNALLWIAVLALAAVVLALIRQIGVLHERVAPAGALMMGGGPKVGELAPRFAGDDVFGRPVQIGGADASGAATLLLFVSPSCPVCKTLLPVAKSMAAQRRGALRLVLASDGPPEEQRRFAEENGLGAFPYLVSAQLGLAHQVAKLPHAVLIDAAGVLRAKGLVNTREHLESLFEAQARGVASIQEFVAAGEERPLRGVG